MQRVELKQACQTDCSQAASAAGARTEEGAHGRLRLAAVVLVEGLSLVLPCSL